MPRWRWIRVTRPPGSRAASLRLDDGELAAAAADFEAARALDPAAFEPRLRLAQVQLRRGDGPAALALLARLVVEFPADATAWRGLAEAEELAGRIEAALAARERAVALDAGNPNSTCSRR